MALSYETLIFTDIFLEDYDSFTQAEQRQLRKALALLETNERHPSLRVHPLKGSLEGVWSASASNRLRITFERFPDGRKGLISCSHHYGD